MNTVTVFKQQLREKISSNKKKHESEYNQAVIEYNSAMKSYYNQLAEKVNSHNSESGIIPLFKHDPPERPRSYIKEYESVENMLKYEVRDEIELSMEEFSKYIEDDWGWKDTFIYALSKNRTYM